MSSDSPNPAHRNGSVAPATTHTAPTIAAFSPVSASPASRSTFQVHQKSPLLVATPPRVTQALSKAYPWVQAANWIMGLLTWTSEDPWESFLLVAAFWAISLYGSFLLRWVGNLFAVVLLIAGMFLRRYREAPTSTTLDEILKTLSTLNTRVDIFFNPFLTLLNVLSTQKTAIKATTRPALTTLFIRILLITPLWLALAIWPFHIITPRRIVLFSGTLMLSWHSRPAKVSRTILWRSETLRTVSELLTGLSLTPSPSPPPLPARTKSGLSVSTQVDQLPTPLRAKTDGASPGVKFTFAIYENQRRWLGIGWTASLFAYERAAWTDEHLNPCLPPPEFTLPETRSDSGVVWRWVDSEDWDIEGVAKVAKDEHHHGKKQEVKDRLGGSGESGEGWWYYDNKWRDGRRGVDGWGKYTRRRKWYRRAELVEDSTPEPAPPTAPSTPPTPTSTSSTSSAKKATPRYPPRSNSYTDERLEEDLRDDSSDEEYDSSERGRPQIRVVDVDEDGRETILAEGVDLDSESGSGSSSRGGGKVVKRKPIPPPLPARGNSVGRTT